MFATYILVFATAAAHSNFISVGLTQGYSGIMLPQLDVSDVEGSWIASLGVAMTPLGSLLSGILVDYCGRKKSLLFPNIPFVISWLLIGFSKDLQMLCVGRALSGVAAGMVPASYLYVSEIASKNQRGILAAGGPVFVSLGVLAVFVLGLIFDWRAVAFVSPIVSLISVILIWFVPESPSYLVSIQENDKALAALKSLRRNSQEANKEYLLLEQTYIEKTKESNTTELAERKLLKKAVKILSNFINNLCLPEVYKPFFILILFFFIQAGSGVYILLFYTVSVLKELGTVYDNNVIVLSLGVIRLISSIAGSFLLIKFGRRQLSVFSGAFMGFSLFIICIYFMFESMLNESYHIIPIFCLLFHVGFSMVGFLQIPWILNGELFPSQCRGVMGGITGSIAYIFIFISIKTYPALLAQFQIQSVLWLYFLITALGSLLLAFLLPETKDKSLEEISARYMRKPKTKIANV